MELRIALVGTDTSHSLHFTRLLNDGSDPQHVPGGRVVAAIADPYGSIAGSPGKALKNAATLKEDYGVPLIESIDELPEGLDGIFILGTDGGRHPAQFQECSRRGVPIFIDKPLALSSGDAEEIFQLAGERSAPVFSTSSLRYEDNFRSAIEACGAEPVTGADFYGYMELLESAPGYFWYGIHVVEILLAAMGPGLQRVELVHEPLYDVLTGVWNDGRLGVLRGTRAPHYIYGGTVHTAAGPHAFAAPEDTSLTYARLMKRVVEFVRTGVSPVDSRETLEIIRFLETAESLRQMAPSGRAAGLAAA